MNAFLESIVRLVVPRHPEHTPIVQEKADRAKEAINRQNEEASRLTRELLALQASLQSVHKKGQGTP